MLERDTDVPGDPVDQRRAVGGDDPVPGVIEQCDERAGKLDDLLAGDLVDDDGIGLGEVLEGTHRHEPGVTRPGADEGDAGGSAGGGGSDRTGGAHWSRSVAFGVDGVQGREVGSAVLDEESGERATDALGVGGQPGGGASQLAGAAGARDDDAQGELVPVVAEDDLTRAQARLAEDARRVNAFLAKHGIDPAQIQLQDLSVTDTQANRWGGQPAARRYIISQTIMVRSTDPEVVFKASQAVGELVNAGVVLQSEGPWAGGPTYLFTRLNDLKPEMIAEATANAREAAERLRQLPDLQGHLAEVEGQSAGQETHLSVVPACWDIFQGTGRHALDAALIARGQLGATGADAGLESVDNGPSAFGGGLAWDADGFSFHGQQGEDGGGQFVGENN